MRVFATLRSEQIDLSRTQAEGVRDLKHFLEFAERGFRALGEAIDVPGNEFDSYFEEVVASRLQKKGWTVHSQIGVSGFRIDLGIVHPVVPGRYIAGIECDGATYHRSATARDRDFLRERILRNLGWEIIRIWSTDWWADPDAATQRVDRELRAILEKR
jgi:very-short-patch-repair endonuclease